MRRGVIALAALAMGLTAVGAGPARADNPPASSAQGKAPGKPVEPKKDAKKEAPAKEPPREEPAGTEGAAPAAEPLPQPSAAATPLPVRHDKPLALAPEARGIPIGAKLGVVALVAGAGAWAWSRRRQKARGMPARTHTLEVLARTSIGVRSELIVVDVDGQSLLLGVTPASIQRLAVLPDPAFDAATTPDAPAEPEDELLEPAFARALERLTKRPTLASPRDSTERPSTTPSRDLVAAPPSSREAPTARPAKSRSGQRPELVEGQARGLVARRAEGESAAKLEPTAAARSTATPATTRAPASPKAARRSA